MKDTHKAPLKRIALLSQLKPYLKPYWFQITLASVALIVAAGTVLGLGRGLQYLIDDGFSSENTDFLNNSLTTLLIIVSVLAVASFTRYFFVSWVGERVVADIRKDVYRNLVFLDPTFYETSKTGEVISRMTADLTVLQSVVGSSVSLALRNALMLIGGMVMLAVTSPKLMGLVVLVIPVVLIPIIYWGRKVRVRSKIAQDKVGDLGGFIDETLHAIQTVQSNTRETLTAQEFDDVTESAYKSARYYILYRAVMSAMVIFIVFGAIGVVLWIGGHDVIKGTMSAGELSAFIFYSVVVAGAAGVISEVIGNLQRAAGATERLFDLKTQRPDIRNTPGAVAMPPVIQGKINFKDVRFYYPSSPEKQAIADLNLSVKAGQTVALVGPSGAGKSTLFNLILRFYDPQSGVITIDDQDIRELDIQSFRSHIAIVPQEPFIFSGSVYENIAFARPDASLEMVQEAAKRAHADGFIQKMAGGYDALLGERGNRLSGGEKQRIAIARAILRNPSILLLDEATSALDSSSEKQVQSALEELMQGRTTLVIAHRLSTVKNADMIVVLDEGRIVEWGTHSQLMKNKNGLYTKLASLQFKEAA